MTCMNTRAKGHDEALAFEGIVVNRRMENDEERLEPEEERALGWIELIHLKMAGENHAHSIDASVVKADLLERE
jgi:hypothetical protein